MQFKKNVITKAIVMSALFASASASANIAFSSLPGARAHIYGWRLHRRGKRHLKYVLQPSRYCSYHGWWSHGLVWWYYHPVSRDYIVTGLSIPKVSHWLTKKNLNLLVACGAQMWVKTQPLTLVYLTHQNYKACPANNLINLVILVVAYLKHSILKLN